MKKQFEIEMRAEISGKQRDKIISKLTSLSAKNQGYQILTDWYFCPIKVKNFHEIEMHEVGSYSLRVRSKKSNKDSSVSLNVKVITQEGDHNSWKEQEISTNSFTDTVNILKSLGYKVFIKITKQRTTYKLNNFYIHLEHISGFGHVLEIEVLTYRNSVQIKKSIQELFTKLGIPSSQIVPKSITNILIKKKAKF